MGILDNKLLTDEQRQYVIDACERARLNPRPRRQPLSDAEWERRFAPVDYHARMQDERIDRILAALEVLACGDAGLQQHLEASERPRIFGGVGNYQRRQEAPQNPTQNPNKAMDI